MGLPLPVFVAKDVSCSLFLPEAPWDYFVLSSPLNTLPCLEDKLDVNFVAQEWLYSVFSFWEGSWYVVPLARE